MRRGTDGCLWMPEDMIERHVMATSAQGEYVQPAKYATSLVS